jgi:hypothetical protein
MVEFKGVPLGDSFPQSPWDLSHWDRSRRWRAWAALPPPKPSGFESPAALGSQPCVALSSGIRQMGSPIRGSGQDTDSAHGRLIGIFYLAVLTRVTSDPRLAARPSRFSSFVCFQSPIWLCPRKRPLHPPPRSLSADLRDQRTVCTTTPPIQT